MSEQTTVLVTGGLGFIGAAAVRHILNKGHRVVVADTGHDRYRLGYWMTPDEIKGVDFAYMDVTSYPAVLGTMRLHKVTHGVHLAGMQVPMCRANPLLGMNVNVGGTLNILLAAKEQGGQFRGLSIASSVASEGAKPGSDATTLYGVFKRCGEGMAKVFDADYKISSVSLLPYIVYGKGRDLGLTSALTKATLAAAADQAYHIPFGGTVVLQEAAFVGMCFVEAALAERTGSIDCKVGGPAVTVADFVAALKRVNPGARITWDDAVELPFAPVENDDALGSVIGDELLRTRPSLDTMVATHYADFRKLVAAGAIDLAQLKA